MAPLPRPTEVDPTPPGPESGPTRGITEEEWVDYQARNPEPIDLLEVALESAITVMQLRDALADYVKAERKARGRTPRDPITKENS